MWNLLFFCTNLCHAHMHRYENSARNMDGKLEMFENNNYL